MLIVCALAADYCSKCATYGIAFGVFVSIVILVLDSFVCSVCFVASCTNILECFALLQTAYSKGRRCGHKIVIPEGDAQTNKLKNLTDWSILHKNA